MFKLVRFFKVKKVLKVSESKIQVILKQADLPKLVISLGWLQQYICQLVPAPPHALCRQNYFRSANLYPIKVLVLTEDFGWSFIIVPEIKYRKIISPLHQNGSILQYFQDASSELIRVAPMGLNQKQSQIYYTYMQVKIIPATKSLQIYFHCKDYRYRYRKTDRARARARARRDMQKHL